MHYDSELLSEGMRSVGRRLVSFTELAARYSERHEGDGWKKGWST